MFKKLKVIMLVMKQGEKLANPIPWKNAQALTGLLVGAIPVALLAVNMFTPLQLDLTDDQISDVANWMGGIGVSLFGLFNTYVAWGSSDTV